MGHVEGDGGEVGFLTDHAGKRSMGRLVFLLVTLAAIFVVVWCTVRQEKIPDGFASWYTTAVLLHAHLKRQERLAAATTDKGQ